MLCVIDCIYYCERPGDGIKPEVPTFCVDVGLILCLKAKHSSQCDKLWIITIHWCFKLADTLIGTQDA
jgi:hypothetical protein